MTSILGALDTILASLPAGSLTDEERASYLAINVENKVFADDVLTEMSGPAGSLLPGYVTSAPLQNDLTIFEQLDQLIGRVDQVRRKCSDLQRIAGSEAYNMALNVYGSIELAHKGGIPGAKESYAKLQERFDKQGGRPKGSFGTLPDSI